MTMKEFKFITQFKELKSTLSTMTYKEKLQHLWTYYALKTVVILLCLIMLFSIVLASCENRQINVIVGGVMVNVDISDAGEHYLKDGYKAFVGSESEKDRVSLSYMSLGSAETTVNSDNYYALQSVLALVAGKDLDYLITDEEAFLTLLKQDIYADLRNVYTEEELETMGEAVVYYQEQGSSKKIPVAIDIQKTAFVRDNTTTDGMVYFIFIANSERIEQTKDLLEYLKDWPAKK